MATFTASILTPDSVFAEKEVSMVVLPSSEGQLGILADHIPIIFKLGPGLIELYSGNSKIEEVFVYGGFGEFSDNKLSILADQVKKLSQLDSAEAKDKIESLNHILATSLDISHNEQVMNEIRVYQEIIDTAR